MTSGDDTAALDVADVRGPAPIGQQVRTVGEPPSAVLSWRLLDRHDRQRLLRAAQRMPTRAASGVLAVALGPPAALVTHAVHAPGHDGDLAALVDSTLSGPFDGVWVLSVRPPAAASLGPSMRPVATVTQFWRGEDCELCGPRSCACSADVCVSNPLRR